MLTPSQKRRVHIDHTTFVSLDQIGPRRLLRYKILYKALELNPHAPDFTFAQFFVLLFVTSLSVRTVEDSARVSIEKQLNRMAK